MKVGLPARKTDRISTYADYRTWPDDERWELIDGAAWTMSQAPSSRHQGILLELCVTCSRQRGGGRSIGAGDRLSSLPP